MNLPIVDNSIFRLFSFEDETSFSEFQRTNCYSVIFVNGNGIFRAEGLAYPFEGMTLICLSPYQPYMINAKGTLEGYILHFHSDFLCVYRHHKEIACNGVLFDNIYRSPILKLTRDEGKKLYQMLQQMEVEVRDIGLAQHELLVSYLKIFLISATRIKVVTQPDLPMIKNEPSIVKNLKDAIEHYFRKEHSAGYYCGLLNISTKALAKIVKNHLGKTITHLISERITVEAKRELYLTSKPIKEIAGELCFNDEYYFSRFF
jgi:AraC family transcriptional activator of pobA